jgi:uncharacterized protein involved in exopolysaccharide biosynthesis/Mrp family chromosome partitioning ATPase
MEIKKYWEILVRRKWLLIQSLGVILFISLLICFIPKRIYEIPAILQVTGQDLQPQFVGDMPTNLGRINATSPALNELETLASDELISQLIRELKLTDSGGDPYSPVKFANPGFFTILTQQIGVSIENPEDTDIINIYGYSTNPEQAVAIANGLVQRYLVLKSLSNKQEAKKAIAYISDQLPKVKEELTKAEEEEQAYSQKEHLATVETQRTNLANLLDSINSALLTAQRTLKTDNERKKAVKTELAKQPELQQATVNTESNPTLESLKISLYGFERDLAQLTSQYTNEHPDVKSKQEQIAETKKQIKDQIEKTFASSAMSRNAYYDNLIQQYGNNEIELVTTQAAVKTLSDQSNEITQKLDAIDRKALELSRLDRVTTAVRNRYNTLLSQLQNAKLAAQLEVTNVVLLSAAVVPKDYEVLKTYAYFPKRKWVMIIGAAFGVMFGLFLVYFIEYLDDHIYRADQVRNITRLPILATIPFLETGIGTIASLPPEIKVQIWNLSILLLAEKKTEIIAVLSQKRNEGKTFLTAALGEIFASQGKKTLVIDGNIKSPRSYPGRSMQLAQYYQHYYHVQDMSGGSFQISAGAEPAPVATSIAGLDILVSLPQSVIENPEKLELLLQSYRQKYAVIIFDTPSLDISPIGSVIAQYTQQPLLIIGSGISSSSETKQWLSALTAAKPFEISGIILNKTS